MGEKNRNVISVDMGTGSVRACLVSDDLKIIYKSQIEVGLLTDASGKAVQDADEIIEKSLECISSVIAWADEKEITIEAISFSNAVSSLVTLDKEFQPTGPVYTYADTRAHQTSEKLRQEYDADLFRFSACPLHASYWPPKLLWLKKSAPVQFKSNYFCTLKDLLVYRLCGEFIIDYSNAVATGLCDVRTGDWDAQLLGLSGISRKNLPTIVPTTTIVQSKKSKYFDRSIPIVLGATDGVLSSLGAGAFNPGQVTTMIGSSGACRIASRSPLIAEKENVIWSYPLDESIWIRGGAMNSGGLVMQWASQNFYHDDGSEDSDRLEAMFKQAEAIAPGAGGLLFLPYIYGERAPIWNENARGVYFGIHAEHQPAHFFRATVEGILFALFSIFEIIRADEEENFELRASGGYTRSDLMLQAQADLFGQRVNVPSQMEGSSIGAATLAFKAIGRFKNYQEIEKKILISRSFETDPAHAETYRAQYRRFKTLYQTLTPLMADAGASQ